MNIEGEGNIVNNPLFVSNERGGANPLHSGN
jgi:hypothetical protein